MTKKTLDLSAWLNTPLGQYLLGWEKQLLDKAVEDIFGYNALQLGLPILPALENNRMPNRWLVLEKDLSPSDISSAKPDLITNFDALPFEEQSIDLVILPHTLDLAADPHATLREVTRVLRPEGKVVITCINPASLWGILQRRVQFAQKFGENAQFLPLGQGSLIGYWRLRDWLRLLNLEITAGRFGCYRPAFKKQKWLDRTAWMEPAGDRWWPIFGAVYQITATKRIKGARLIDPRWKKVKEKANVALAGSSKTQKTPHKKHNN